MEEELAANELKGSRNSVEELAAENWHVLDSLEAMMWKKQMESGRTAVTFPVVSGT